MSESKLAVYNTLSRSEEPFAPMHERKVNMFVCGNTVYDDAHLGHAKTYIDFAIIARWLRHLGYELRYAQNITDVDDKIIARAKERGIEARELAATYEKRFMEDMEALGIRKDVDVYPRSHDYIETIREQIQLLLDKGYAYLLEGDVYYDVARFKDYTKLSRMKLDELKRHRIEPKEGKINQYDFSLWKAAKAGEPRWEIKVMHKGNEVKLIGRPGWHIEDTAMTYALFGPQYDVHGGANELIFPHHTNEIAQAEAAFGKIPFVKYWLHSGVLNIKDVKMSKSLRNFITIRDFLKNYDAEVFRLLVCSTHYRKDIDYSDALVKEAQKRLRYLYAAFGIFFNMSEAGESDNDRKILEISQTLENEFAKAMNSDFNTPLALSKLVQAVKALREFSGSNEKIGKKAKENAAKIVLNLANVLGLLESDRYKEKMPQEVLDLIKKREALRAEKKFAEADKIRDEVKKHGVAIEDTEFGSVWYRNS